MRNSHNPITTTTTNPIKKWATLEGWDREGGREMQEGGDMGIYVYV